MLFYIFLLLVVDARTIYKIQTRGSCSTPAVAILNDNVCETQATAAGWTYTTMTTVSFSSYLPQGCTFDTATSKLKLYSKESSITCSAEYQCLCEITAPDCEIGINRQACLCSNNVCTEDSGLLCLETGQCQHPSNCRVGMNSDVCQCGSKDCTPTSGLMCNDNSCRHPPICPNRIGTIENQETCLCGETDCSPQLGIYCHAEQSTCRQPCPGGTFVNHLLQCIPCHNLGYYCPAGATTSATSYKCPVGRYGDEYSLATNTECKECSAGRFSIIAGITSSEHCTGRCSAGRYSSETGIASDNGCIGRCSAGRYSSETGLTTGSCNGRCPAGRYSNEIGKTSPEQCKDCSSGRYSSETGSTSNDDCMGRCPPGTFSDKEGLTASNDCEVCSVNKYQNEYGTLSCKGCPNNKIIQDTFSAEMHDSVEDCIIQVPVCDAAEHILNNTCQQCESTFFCDGTSKFECQPGSYCTGIGPATPCPTGRYGELKKQASKDIACQKCQPGTYQNVIGQTYCSRGCPRGTFGQIDGATTIQEGCTPCLKGHMCDDTAMNRPVKCPMGSYQADYGQEKCLFCPMDTYSDTSGSIQCTSCGMTKQRQQLRTNGLGANSQSQCELLETICPPTQRPNNKGLCEDCPRGFFSNSKGTRCILCPKGYMQPLPAQKLCQKCSNKRCLAMFGSSDVTDTVPMSMTPGTTKTLSESPSISFPVTRIVIYASILLIILLIVGTHRLCPICCKQGDLIFSGDHHIQDTHAHRVLETRLGTALTLSLPFVVAGIAVFIFTKENRMVVQGLIPIAITEIPPDYALYKQINVLYKTETAAAADCSIIQVQTHMNCSTQKRKVSPNICNVVGVCTITPPFGGVHYIEFIVPDKYQHTSVSVAASSWNNSIDNITVAIQSQIPLIGTTVHPSTIDFDVVRSKTHNSIQRDIDYGLKMTLRATKFITGSGGSIDGTHVVKLRFFSTETLFNMDIVAKLDIVTQIGTVLTLTISALSILRIIKVLLEQCLDKSITRCFTHTPQDIQTRTSILEEITPTKNTLTKNPLTNNTSINNTSTVGICTKRLDNTRQIIQDEVSGRRYVYNAATKKSTWLEEHL